MKTFYLNNSSLPILSCSKQYHLRVVTGLKPPPGGNKYTTPGLAFHKMMQLHGTKEVPDILTACVLDKKSLPPVISSAITDHQCMQLAQLAKRIHDEHPELFADCYRELHFQHNAGQRTNNRADEWQTIHFSHTDTDHYDANTDTVILTDYKTTGKPIDGGLITAYNLTSQRYFYLLAAYYLDNLPPHFKAAIQAHRLAWRYCYVGIEKDTYHLAAPTLVNLNELEVFARLFHEKALYAAAIHRDPEALAVKDGILNGQCWKCPFTSICTAEIEDNLITNWPYGKKPYTYHHNDE